MCAEGVGVKVGVGDGAGEGVDDGGKDGVDDGVGLPPGDAPGDALGDGLGAVKVTAVAVSEVAHPPVPVSTEFNPIAGFAPDGVNTVVDEV